mmetsp:Transcript_36387/g.116623  ORF Transcript_36387/g.116623 Transcript_36387/m.116623 type:complete len:227 (-) Transcript_36387:237-917(-)
MNETAGRSNVYRSSDSTTHVGGTGTHPPRSSMPRVATLLREREAPRAREEEEEEAASACLLFLHGGSHVVLAILVFAGGEGGLEAEADAEVLDELRGDVGLPAVEVVEDAASLGDEADEAAARGVVLGIFDDVLCDVLDPGGEEGHLDLRAAAVRHVPREPADGGSHEQTNDRITYFFWRSFRSSAIMLFRVGGYSMISPTSSFSRSTSARRSSSMSEKSSSSPHP